MIARHRLTAKVPKSVIAHRAVADQPPMAAFAEKTKFYGKN